MDEHHYQIQIPESFMALYLVGGRIKPTASRAAIAARYELCEDMANHLQEYAAWPPLRPRHFGRRGARALPPRPARGRSRG
jgi:hypothetical protein